MSVSHSTTNTQPAKRRLRGGAGKRAVVYIDLQVAPYNGWRWPDGTRLNRHLALPYGRPVRLWTREDIWQILRQAAACVPSTHAVWSDRLRWCEMDRKLFATLRLYDAHDQPNHDLGLTITFPGRFTAADVLRLMPIGGWQIAASLEEQELRPVRRRPAPARAFDVRTEHVDHLPLEVEHAGSLDAIIAKHDAEVRVTAHRRGIAVHVAREAGAR